jgi:hypothetical protein
LASLCCFNAGLREGKLAVSDITETEGGDEDRAQRVEQRDSMLLHATLRRAADASGTPIRIRNLSAGGMMAECSLPLARGEAVEINLRNVGAVRAAIAWAVDGRIGGAFDAPIDRLRARRPVPVAPLPRTKPKPPQSRRPGLRIS